MILYIAGCSTNTPEAVEPSLNIPVYGKQSSFEIATWNIEHFPKHNKTLELVKAIIETTDVDLIAIQEIESVDAFNYLVSELEEWKGYYSSDSYYNGTYQKTGLLYKSDFISVSSVRNIFTDDTTDAFPRPPLAAYVQVKDYDSTKYDFNIIVLHLKASGFGEEADNVRRRKEACQKLETYISDEINAGADADFIVLGDWNDELTDTGSDNVFTPFLEKPELYTFLTYNLPDVSYPGYNSLIDQILITNDSEPEFDAGDVEVLKLDDDILFYDSYVSDHRPVVARFKGFKLNLVP